MTPKRGDASSGARIAASLLWRALVVVAGLHAYWALGRTWGLDEASGGAYTEATTGVRIGSAVVAILLVAACLLVRARVGLWRTPVPDRVLRTAMWALTAVLAVTALLNLAEATSWERFGIGPFALLLSLLALVVALAGRECRGAHRHGRTLPSH